MLQLCSSSGPYSTIVRVTVGSTLGNLLHVWHGACKSAAALLRIYCTGCMEMQMQMRDVFGFSHGACTLLGLDGFQLFPRVPSGAFRALAVVLNPWCSAVLGIPAFACCVPGGVYGM